MTRCVFALLVLLAGAEPALAGSPETGRPDHLVVVVAAASDSDLAPAELARVADLLRDALAGRAGVGPSDMAPQIVVRFAVSPAAVEVAARGRVHRLAVSSWDEATLRAVALQALDLVQPPAELLEWSEAAKPSPPRAAAPAVPSDAAPVAVLSAPRGAAPGQPGQERPVASQRPVFLRAAATAFRGLAATDPPTSAGAIASLHVADRWRRVGLAAGWAHAFRSHAGQPNEAVADGWSLRLEGAALFGSLEIAVSAGALVSRLAGNGVVLWSASPSAGLFVGLHAPLAGRVTAVVGGGVDVSARRAVLTIGEVTAYSAPRLAPYLALALELPVAP